MVTVLITGGAGFVPSSLADRLLERGDYKVVLVDNLLTGKMHNVPDHPNCDFIEGDVNQWSFLKGVFEKYQFDYVFHYAAVVGVQRTLQHPLAVLQDVDGIKNVLELCCEYKVKRVFYSSSSEVYGEPVVMPQHEHTTPLNSRLPYAVVKNIGECFCRSYHQEKGLDFTIFRFFNTYGPKQSEDFVMSKFLNAALRNQDITVYGDGSQSRTFCNINDNVDACIETMLNDAHKNQVFNIGNDEVITIKELAETIIQITGSTSKIVHLPPLKEGDMSKRQPDITQMRQLLNRPLTPYQEGIKKILNAWKAR